jgi:hypothetical protein
MQALLGTDSPYDPTGELASVTPGGETVYEGGGMGLPSWALPVGALALMFVLTQKKGKR